MDQTALTQFSHQSLLPKAVVVAATTKWAVLVDQAVVVPMAKTVALGLQIKDLEVVMRLAQWALEAAALVPQVWTAQQLLSEQTEALV
jgi:hypothetical protein